jgi:hypothetical protein
MEHENQSTEINISHENTKQFSNLIIFCVMDCWPIDQPPYLEGQGLLPQPLCTGSEAPGSLLPSVTFSQIGLNIEERGSGRIDY